LLKDQLPSLYNQFFSEDIKNFSINEKLATCDNCALSNGQSPDKRNYKPNLKCCTFQPFQTNYLLGEILGSSTIPIEVYSRIQTMIETHEYALPIGIVASIPKQIEFHKTKKDFGNLESMLCPYFDRVQNNCGIWKSRSSVCTSFHCLSSYGKKGFAFWDSLSNYISFIEMAFMEECLLKLNFTPIEISKQVYFLDEFKKKPKENFGTHIEESFAKQIWKKYYLDKEGFYIKCFEIIQNISPAKFKKILGEQGKSIKIDLYAAMQNIS
jgi:Fe-S-cluster containining protein